MKHYRKIGLLAPALVALSGLFAGGVLAATYTVSKTSPADYTTVLAAVTQTNLDVAADVIQILDSSTYDEGGLDLKESVRIEAASGQTPLITRTTGAGAVITFLANTDGRVFQIGSNSGGRIGVSSSLATIMRNDPSTVNHSSTTITLENLDIFKPTSPTIATGQLVYLEDLGQHAINNCSFYGGDDTKFTRSIDYKGAGKLTITDSSLRTLTSARPQILLIKHASGSGDVTITNSTIRPTDGYSSGGIYTQTAAEYAGTVRLEDCTLGTGGTGLRFVRNSSPSAKWEFIRPTFVDACGDVAFDLSLGGALTIEGKPAAGEEPAVKVDLDPLGAGGCLVGIRCVRGTVNLTDCKASVKPAYALVDAFAGTATHGDVVINMNRCHWLNGSGRISLDAGGTTDYFTNVSVNATNTIWQGGAGVGHLIDLADDYRYGTGSVTLNHCTMTGQCAGYLVRGNLAYMSYPADTLTGNYCIFDSQNAAAGSNLDLAGTMNLCCKALPVNHGFPSAPGDTIIAMPMLTNTGYTSGWSVKAHGRAVGSSLAIDIDGKTRPIGGTHPDIGANEVTDTPLYYPSSVADLKQLPTSYCQVTATVTMISHPEFGFFYIEDANRAAGIKCDVFPTSGLTVGDTVTVRGIKYHNTDFNDPPDGHEYVVFGGVGDIVSRVSGTPLEPLAMVNRVAQTAWNHESQEPLGLFVKVWGVVTMEPNGQIYYIDDGSGNSDLAYPGKGLCVFYIAQGQTPPGLGDHVAIEGCLGQQDPPGGARAVVPVVWQSNLQTIVDVP